MRKLFIIICIFLTPLLASDYPEINVLVICHYLNKGQLEEVLSSEGSERIETPTDQLDPHELYLLVRVKNRGFQTAFGSLQVQVPNQEEPILIHTSVLPQRMRNFCDYVIPIENRFDPSLEYPPQPQIEWGQLDSF